MLRKFVTGLVWGGIVAGLGLAVISQVAPLPPSPDLAASGQAVPAAAEPAAPPPEVVSDQSAAVAEAGTEAPGGSGVDGAGAEAGGASQASDTPADAAAERPAPESATQGPASAQVAPTEPQAAPAAAPAAAIADQPAPVAQADLGGSDSAPAHPPTAETPADLAGEGAAPFVVASKSPVAPMAEAGGDAAAPAVSPSDAAPASVEGPPPVSDRDEPLLAPAPQTAPPPETPPAPPVVAEQAPPRLLMPDGDAGLPGKQALVLPDPQPEARPGGTSLPQIGAAPAADPAATAAPVPEAEVIADLPPMAAFARPFENAEAKPLFAILLVDDGRADLDRTALAALPFPVTFVVDPQAANAAEAAAIYRAGLQEVVMAATGLPEGAEAADIERSFEANAAALPETVAVIDSRPQGPLENRDVAATVVPILRDQGRGLITYDLGLNAADQAARRAGLPTATLFRVLDGDSESQPTIRRYLDRAAFKAAQEGRVVVIGSTRPETVAAILEWTVEGRAASVALAPVTAVLAAP